MTRLSCWLVRLAHIHLVVGFLVGGLLLAGKGMALPPAVWALRGVHVEVLLFGFVVQLAFGVAVWILPRTARRRSDLPAGVAGVLLNAGVLAACGGFVGGGAALVAAGRTMEAAAMAVFVWAIWPRVRAAQVR